MDWNYSSRLNGKSESEVKLTRSAARNKDFDHFFYLLGKTNNTENIFYLDNSNCPHIVVIQSCKLILQSVDQSISLC